MKPGEQDASLQEGCSRQSGIPEESAWVQAYQKPSPYRKRAKCNFGAAPGVGLFT